MTLKLALRNIRRTIGNYAIYFVTLVLGVAVFYAFNSIESQQVLLDIEASERANIIESTQFMLSMVSYAVAFVLGFLVVYANRFLIRRRKREFGTYLVLGMPPSKVAFIVLVETVVVGVVSLAVGSLAGVLLSQGLAFATAALFGTTISDYHFVFSAEAFALTLVCFAVIYVVVAVFNVVSVSRFRLIDLLHAEHRNERAPVRNPWVCLAVFAVSIAMIAYAYMLLAEDGMQEIGTPLFVRSTVFMLVGSLAFFWSLAGLVVGALSRIDGVYLRGLVPFTVRQFAAKINTAWVTLWTTCIMLFFAITIFSTGMGLVDVFVGNIERYTPYDASFRAETYAVLSEEELEKSGGLGEYDVGANPYELSGEAWESKRADAEKYGFDALACLEGKVPGWNDLVKAAAEIDVYKVPGTNMGELLRSAGIDTNSGFLATSNLDGLDLEVMPLSHYNATLALVGGEPVSLGEGEYVIDNTLAAVQSEVDHMTSAGTPIEVGGVELRPVEGSQHVNLQTSAMDSAAFAFVVPDAAVDALRAQGVKPFYSYVNAMYRTPGADTDTKMEEALAAAFPSGKAVDDAGEPAEWVSCIWPAAGFYTQAEMRSQAGGLRLMITYLALYIGFVLLVATAAILAIQQLTESVDSLQRYRMLWRLGCDERMLFRSLFVQVLVYFLAPLALAASHSACAASVLSNTLIGALGGQDVLTPMLMAAGFTVAIYGGYLLITYAASRRVVKGGLRARES